MKKISTLKRLVSIFAVTAFTALVVQGTNVFAATCPPHYPNNPVRTLTGVKNTGTHSHYMYTDTNGNAVFKTCSILVYTYSVTQTCQACGATLSSSTVNQTVHTAA